MADPEFRSVKKLRVTEEATIEKLADDLNANSKKIYAIGVGAGADGENFVFGKVQVYTSNATPDTEDTIAHGLGRAPIGFIVINKDKAGDVYDGGTTWTTTNIYLKCSVASVTVKMVVF